MNPPSEPGNDVIAATDAANFDVGTDNQISDRLICAPERGMEDPSASSCTDTDAAEPGLFDPDFAAPPLKSAESSRAGDAATVSAAAAFGAASVAPASIAAAVSLEILPLLLFEGTSTGFIIPFVVSDQSGGNPTHPIRQIAKLSPALAGLPIYFGILNISSFTDTVSEQLMFAGRAEVNPAKKKKHYQQAMQRLQEEAHLTNIAFTQYSLTSNKLGGIAGHGGSFVG